MMDSLMKLNDALRLADFFLPRFNPACEPGCCVAAGGVRRGKPDVHDLEIVCKPILKTPRLEFGQKFKDAPKTLLDKVLLDLVQEEYLIFERGAERNRKYWINLEKFSMAPDMDFKLDLWMTMLPGQYGVNLVIRTGPNSGPDNFSTWVVTPRASGGALPDGYRMKYAAVWRADQLDTKDKPFDGECPLEMPTEESFLDFLGITVGPADRHADWGRHTR